MTPKNLDLAPAQREKLLRDLWVLCDARWFLKLALNLGPQVANKMNLTVVGSFGKTEIGRLLAESNFGPVSNIQELKDLIEYASDLYFPKEHVYRFEAIDDHTLVGHILECYVHKEVSKAGSSGFYECAGETRLNAWLKGCGLEGSVEMDKDIQSCDGRCAATFKIDW